MTRLILLPSFFVTLFAGCASPWTRTSYSPNQISIAEANLIAKHTLTQSTTYMNKYISLNEIRNQAICKREDIANSFPIELTVVDPTIKKNIPANKIGNIIANNQQDNLNRINTIYSILTQPRNRDTGRKIVLGRDAGIFTIRSSINLNNILDYLKKAKLPVHPSLQSSAKTFFFMQNTNNLILGNLITSKVSYQYGRKWKLEPKLIAAYPDDHLYQISADIDELALPDGKSKVRILRKALLKNLAYLKSLYTLRVPKQKQQSLGLGKSPGTSKFWGYKMDRSTLFEDIPSNLSVTRQKTALWDKYFKLFTRIEELPSPDPQIRNYKISLDLQPFCKYIVAMSQFD